MSDNYKKIKTLVNVDVPTWANLKHFATIKQLSIDSALGLLLIKALNSYGYIMGETGTNTDPLIHKDSTCKNETQSTLLRLTSSETE
jgi:hypothetical protein